MRCSRARSLFSGSFNKFPFKGVSIFLSDIAIINSWTLNESSINQESFWADLGEGMVISWLWDSSCLLKLSPGMCCGIEVIWVLAIIISANSSEENYRVSIQSWFMMRQFSWLLSLALDWLPGDSERWVLNKPLNALNRKSPHIAHWTFLDISATMNIEIVVNNKRAVVWSSLW